MSVKKQIKALRESAMMARVGNLEFWSPQEKEKYLEDIDKEIAELEKTLMRDVRECDGCINLLDIAGKSHSGRSYAGPYCNEYREELIKTDKGTPTSRIIRLDACIRDDRYRTRNNAVIN